MAKDNPKAELARRFRLQMCDPECPNDNRVLVWSVSEIIKYINLHHSSKWVDYDVSDWREGLKEWTWWKILSEENSSEILYDAENGSAPCFNE